LGFNHHGHVLVTDGCFPEKGLFKVVPTVKLKYLEKIFRSKVLTLLLAKGKITPDLIKLLKSWRHSLRVGGRVSGFLRPPHPSPGKSLYGLRLVKASLRLGEKTWLGTLSGPLSLKNE